MPIQMKAYSSRSFLPAHQLDHDEQRRIENATIERDQELTCGQGVGGDVALEEHAAVDGFVL